VLWVTEQKRQHFPAFTVAAKDTTAAGDVFNGYLAAALAEQKAWDQAIPFAMAAAAISVTREGAIPSIPKADEVLRLMQATRSE